MRKPRLLDLFCGAGGAAKGYQNAGFYVVGVDIKPQPNYCGDEFVQDDALSLMSTYPWWDVEPFDAVHASPPCQGYANVTLWRGDQDDHPKLIEPVRELLRATGLPYVIENVRTNALEEPIVLCGSAFGLPVRRHRYFETNWLDFMLVPACDHSDLMPFEHKAERLYTDGMGCEWMTAKEGREAIPPAYTEHIGHQLMQHITKAAA